MLVQGSNEFDALGTSHLPDTRISSSELFLHVVWIVSIVFNDNVSQFRHVCSIFR